MILLLASIPVCRWQLLFLNTGGSYYYHWMRDAGLSIKAWMDINDNDYETVSKSLSASPR